ncbi:unnamed protein product [Ilex paraguariensis]|uniref:Secreted protein n=1 Tax=Ilex paraguariensis TaxID=185542 RepID=A0ABC8URI4_9AQUA
MVVSVSPKSTRLVATLLFNMNLLLAFANIRHPVNMVPNQATQHASMKCPNQLIRCFYNKTNRKGNKESLRLRKRPPKNCSTKKLEEFDITKSKCNPSPLLAPKSIFSNL